MELQYGNDLLFDVLCMQLRIHVILQCRMMLLRSSLNSMSGVFYLLQHVFNLLDEQVICVLKESFWLSISIDFCVFVGHMD